MKQTVSDIREFERHLKGGLPDILNRRKTLVEQTSDDIWGAEMIRVLPAINNGEYTLRMKLETWTIPFIVGTQVPIDWNEYLTNVGNVIGKYEYEKFKFLGSDKKRYRVHQLCDWRWLEGEDGTIFHEVDIGVYEGKLVKYAVLFPKIEHKVGYEDE